MRHEAAFAACAGGGESGNLLQRDQRGNDGVQRVYNFYYDGDSRLRRVAHSGGSPNVFTATYDSSGLRKTKWDTWTANHHLYVGRRVDSGRR